MKFITIGLLLAISVLAQDGSAPAPAPSAPPTITPTQTTNYLYAQLELLQAEQAMKDGLTSAQQQLVTAYIQKLQALNTQMQALNDACGPNHSPAQNGKAIICQPKPASQPN